MQTSKIKRLSGHVVDQIAAGEVIERPSQLVKELIENSLDAGSTKVQISISSGLSSVTVSDNGLGILKEDLPLVFERHSTSKLEKADELFSLESFGFRGEALSAIGSIAKISLESKSVSEDSGNLMIWDSGQEVLVDKSSILEGTKLSVSNLFDNTPARKKFLKSQRYELTLVKKVFNSFALIHFDKEFKMTVDGKLTSMFSAAKTLEERYKQIYKKTLYKIPLPETEFIKRGSSVYLEEPGIESKTSQSLWIYVQSRWIEDRAVHAAVRDGLNTYLMHGCQPQGLVDLKLDPAFVDVNVHPMKSQVRYQDSSHLYKALRSSVSSWASLAPWSKEEGVNIEGINKKLSPEPIKTGSTTFYPASKPSRSEVEAAFKAQSTFEFKEQEQVQYKQTYGNLKSEAKLEKVLKKEDGFEPNWSNLMVVGQVNLTYILAQADNALYFIDQHAAHERVGYEKLVKAWKEKQNSDVQTLLLPLQIEMEENFVEVLLSKEKELLNIGISIEQAGPDVLTLNSHPGFLKENAVAKALKEFAERILKYGGGSSVDEVFELFFATVSCHSVIRAGHAMSPDEMKLLLIEMDKYKSHFCPHGRPVYKKVSFQSLDRDFGRTL